MSFDRNETRTTLETITLGGVDVKHVEVAYNYKPWIRENDAPVERYSYKTIDVTEGATDLESLNNVRIVLEALAQLTELTFAGEDLESLIDTIEEQASELAEELEIHFIYDRDGSKREYTPRSLWEPSGSCSEWEESAQEGYDYGWQI